MAAKKVKIKESEKLTEANIEYVISLLEPKNGDAPITKKRACEILRIAYNTTRLNNIIEGHKHKKEVFARNKAKKANTPITEEEKEEIVSSYLTGVPVADIAKSIFRNSSLVARVIDDLGVPKRVRGEDKSIPDLLPEECMADSLEVGERAWSAKYHAPCEVTKDLGYDECYMGNVYQIYLFQPVLEPIPGFSNVSVGGKYAHAPVYELGSLRHIAKYLKKVI